ncbi:MAG: D-alanyl-D-alanine carboxypeptidase/D-alanyl-D-alanine-endopeptidase [Myxococcales bacterium]|nr:D-alanyl-D-alanine carboxypeptidase/D-alanyl-D-alanine-endopeptidase [Myxococcota bacterium]MDW8283705.1 D-alanyl-D-alanine carboxypeptidase/D-alanyl-D-alanine-endopeptidase [Myxococcales bacterium]
MAVVILRLLQSPALVLGTGALLLLACAAWADPVPPPAGTLAPVSLPVPSVQASVSPLGTAPMRIDPPPADAVQRVRWLNQRIDAILAASSLGRARMGVAVMDIESGRLLYARNEGELLNPASNVKLVTTAAALALLGPEFRCKTALYIDRDHRTNERANLYLRGFGDPTLQAEDLWRLSAELSVRGVRRIGGDIVVDDSYFDDQRIGPGFDQKAEDAPFRAPQGAVSLNLNAVGVRVSPGNAEGDPARVTVEPASAYFVVINEARTTASGRTHITVEASDDKSAAAGQERTVIHVRGAIRRGDASQDFWKRVGHPELYAGYTLRELLLRRGIKVGGRVVRGVVPQGAVLLGTHSSPPLGVIVRDINKRSNNFMAEQVLKILGAETGGRPGTWRKGLEAVARFLEGLGIPPDRYQMTNGSGLYDANRFSAGQIVTILRAAYRDFRYAADFAGSLGISGAEGTISHRMSGGLAERYVRAKTGTLLGVSCLSGYAGSPLPTAPRGPLAFSILMNDLPEDGGPAARQAQDAIAEALVAYLGAPSDQRVGTVR